MAKTRPSKSAAQSAKKKDKREKSLLNANASGTFSSTGLPKAEDTPTLLAAATVLLHANNEPTKALALATRALALTPTSLQALELLAEIHVELGDVAAAHALYTQAAALDPTGAHETQGGSGPEKFLWLAQLSPDGGADAVAWYTAGVTVLRTLIAARDAGALPDLAERNLEQKLASALCGLAELYMSDLCMEADAEARCEGYVTEARLAQLETQHAEKLAQLEQRHVAAVAAKLAQLERKNDAKLAQLERKSDARLAESEKRHQARIAILEKRCEASFADHEGQMDDIKEDQRAVELSFAAKLKRAVGRIGDRIQPLEVYVEKLESEF